MKKYIFLLLSFYFLHFIFSTESSYKKYYNCFFGGGRELITSINGSVKNIEISSANIYINMNRDYSYVKIRYLVKNNEDPIVVYFSYPFLIGNLKLTNGKEEYEIKQFCYENFKIKVDEKEQKYLIKSSNVREDLLPYRVGNIFFEIKNGYEEKVVDMYYYTYGWYEIELSFDKKEKKVIELEYKVPHYFSEILLKKNLEADKIEDPALEYISRNKNEEVILESERVFSFLFNNAYSNDAKEIKKVNITLVANIVDINFLKILPISYKRKRNIFYWKYKNFSAATEDNLIVKILPVYSNDIINPLLFDYFPEKKQDSLLTFFELNNKNNELILSYLPERNNEKILVSKIKIFTEPVFKNNEIKELNRPIKVLIEFSNTSDFTKSIRKEKKISYRNFKKGIKNASITIYDGEPIECKYIKIKILEFSEENEILRINDIAVIKGEL